MLVSLPVGPKDAESHREAPLTMPYRQVREEECETKDRHTRSAVTLRGAQEVSVS